MPSCYANDSIGQGGPAKLSEHCGLIIDHRAFVERLSAFKPQQYARFHGFERRVNRPDRLYPESQKEVANTMFPVRQRCIIHCFSLKGSRFKNVRRLYWRRSGIGISCRE